MKIQHLGTAAAERIPGIFCKCDTCNNARRIGGRAVRTQSQAVVDDTVLLDFPGDTYLHYIRDNFPLPDIRTLLITHWHSDHFYGEDLAYRMGKGMYADCNDSHLDVYGSQTVRGFYDRAFFLEQHHDDDMLSFHTIVPGQSFQVENGTYTIHVFEAAHGQYSGDCVFYAISDGMKSLLYAHDTGYFSEATWQQLREAGLKYDYVSLDCTLAMTPLPEVGVPHMNFDQNLKVRETMCQLGLADDSTIFVANHFSHHGFEGYEDFTPRAESEHFVVSYDGMTCSF